MRADFSPTLGGYSGQGAFRYWCQNVLPLTFDDSISYMELLAKVVTYLNNTITDVATAEDNIDKLNTAYNQLQDYVNTYFDNLDVDESISNKLDSMVADGSLGELVEPFVIDEVDEQISDVVAAQLASVVAEQISAVVASQIDDVVAEQIGDAAAPTVTSWLNAHVTPVGSAVVVDDSLSIEGAAADAKATGDRITGLESNVDNARTKLKTLSASFYAENKYNWDNFETFNGWIGTDGFVMNGGKHAIIPVNGGDSVKIRTASGISFLFYVVKSYTPPTTSSLTPDLATGETGRRTVAGTEVSITLADDAKYIVCTYVDSTNNSRKPIYLFVNNFNFIEYIDYDEKIVKVDYVTSAKPIDGGTETTTVPLDRVSIAGDTKTVFSKLFDGTYYWYPVLNFDSDTIYDVYGVKLVLDDGEFYLAENAVSLDGIISRLTGAENEKLYWHTTNGLIIKGGRNVSQTPSLAISLRGNETFFYNGDTYVVLDGVLTKVSGSESYVKRAMDMISEHSGENQFVNIAFITDTHSMNPYYNTSVPMLSFPGASMEIMKKLSEQSAITHCIHGGDILTTYNAKQQFTKQILENAINANVNFYKNVDGMIFVKGNHDNGHNDDAAYDLSNAEWKSIFQSNVSGAVFGTEANACYFYIDDTSAKVRVIVLDSWYDAYDSEKMSFGSAQETWLYNTALNFSGKSGWSVIVFSHYWGYSNNVITNNPLSENANNILRAFQDKGTTYGSYTFDPSDDTKLVGVVMGHTHADGYNNSQGYNTIRVSWGTGGYNEVGSENAISVSVFTIDTVNSILYQTRLGRGTDASYSYGDNPSQII